MNNKKTNKTQKNNKPSKKEKKGFHSWFSRFKKDLNSKDELSYKEAKKHNDNRKFLYGAILAILSIALFLAMVSHLFTGDEDQKLKDDALHTASNWLGSMGYYAAHFIMDNCFGIASIVIPILLLVTSIRIMNLTKIRLHKWFINCSIIMIWISTFSAYITEYLPWANDSYIVWGGMIGNTQIDILKEKIGGIGVFFTLIITALLYLAYISDDAITTLRSWLTIKEKEEKEELNTEEIPEQIPEQQQETTEENASPVIDLTTDDPTLGINVPFNDDPSKTATTIDFDITTTIPDDLRPGEQPLPLQTEEVMEMEINKGSDPELAVMNDGRTLEPYDPKLDLENYKYPHLDLLKKYENGDTGIDMVEQKENKERIIQVLKNFGVEISSIKATIGPTITLYEITPAPGVRIAKIRNLEDDIALSLRALGIRIIAPIPGKGTIGIEVPNAKPKLVSMESLLNSRKFQETDYELPIALGKTITNEVFMVDLVKMPHLLVAGATGQGKSVGLNAIITSLLYKKHPAELKLVMVDPKKVEFSVYAPIVNHFLAQVEGNEDVEEPIITDVNKVIQTLKSLCVEMDERYDLLKRAQARNVKEYNAKFKDRRLNPENGHKFMPYIVVIIDEFGDLIMTAGKEIELPIARIAQLARAVGIHMIIATQRPAVNIITGTIKANFPARMAFKVASVVDSRTILDRTGANQLVGKGDMLYLAGSEPVRVQCAFVDTPEVENIASYIACQQSYNAPFPLPEVAMEGDDGGDGPDVDMTHLDPMFEEVARMVVVDQNGSTSMIQRKFSIGFNRAGRLMDQLEKAGIVGPSRGSKPREVLCISEDDLRFRLDNLR